MLGCRHVIPILFSLGIFKTYKFYNGFARAYTCGSNMSKNARETCFTGGTFDLNCIRLIIYANGF